MAISLNVPQSVYDFLQKLELELKQIPGVSPEEALSDAREFLLADMEALQRSGEAPKSSDAQLQWFCEKYGDPHQVALQYGESVDPVSVPRRAGFAPGWRICCTGCGRSAPLAHFGAIRIGAKSYHKYLRTFCRSCNSRQFCRVIQDLEDTNLTRLLCMNQSTDELRRTMHRPRMVIASILGLVACILIAQFSVAVGVVWFARNAVAQESIESQSAAFLKLREAVLKQYSYRDLHRVDWEKRFADFAPKLEKTKTREDFAKQAAELMSVAKDIHVLLRYDGKTLGTFQANARPNFNPRVLPRLLKSWKQHGKTVLTGMATESIHYVAIGTWDHSEPASMKAAIEAVREAAASKSPLIIDVRPNSGGDEEQAKTTASFFVQKETPYAQHRLWAEGQLGQAYTRSIQPNPEGIYHPGPCLVLMGSANMSSCESFLMMMKQAKATLVGASSYGTSGNPKPYDLGNGVTVLLPSWQQMDLSGQVIEGKGVTPDVQVETKQSDFASADPVLAKAIELLKK